MLPTVLDVELEYVRKSNLKREDVKTLQEWMSKQSHLPTVSDLQLALFLNSCYFKVEATKNCIEKFYNLKAHCPEFFSERDPSSKSVQQQLRTVLVAKLPHNSPKNYMMIVIKLSNTNPDRFVFNDMVKVIDMGLSVLGCTDGLQDGHVVIFDSAGLQLGHVFKINILALKKALYYVQEAMPIRLKEIHILNVTSITEKLLNIIMPFLQKELVDMIRLHKNLGSLYEHVPQELCPNEFGGKTGSLKEMHEDTINSIQTFSSFYKEEEMLKSDESKRQGKSTNFDNIFGVEGSFKKLDID